MRTLRRPTEGYQACRKTFDPQGILESRSCLMSENKEEEVKDGRDVSSTLVN
jgi:hypothetical protein